MKKEFLVQKIEQGMTFKEKYGIFLYNLYNKLFCRLYRYEIDSLREFYDNREKIHGYCHMTNLEYLGKKSDNLEKIVTLKDSSYSLDFSIKREYYDTSDNYGWLSMDEDNWKIIESLQQGNRINVVFGVGYKIPYLMLLEKISDEHQEKITIPDYPSQLVKKS